MNERAKYHIFCYEAWNYPPQINFITNVHENHPFLLVRNRIDCGADKERFSRVFQSAKKILRDMTYTIEEYNSSYPSNLSSVYKELKEQGFTDLIFRKAGAKPIDGSLRQRHQFNQYKIRKSSKRAHYFDGADTLYRELSKNSLGLARASI